MWISLGNSEGGFHFVEFGKDLDLKEVIVGARSALRKNAIRQVLGEDVSNIVLRKACEDFSSFRMVEDQNFE
jgi:hypothetical protein